MAPQKWIVLEELWDWLLKFTEVPGQGQTQYENRICCLIFALPPNQWSFKMQTKESFPLVTNSLKP